MLPRSCMFALVPLLLTANAAASPFVPKSELWPMWEAHDETSLRQVDHGAWQAILDTYLLTGQPSGINRFDYARVSEPDRERLRTYIAQLAAVDPRELNRAEQRAYWINFYNALTVNLVLEHYPVKSIRKIFGGLLNLGPWKREIVTVGGEPLTLNDIEHRILRPIWQDPRIHYAVNCASLGCPNLASRAFTADNGDALMDALARDFVNHPRAVALAGKRLELSSLYDWYSVDFGGSEAGVIAHLQKYAAPALAQALAGFDGRVRYDYDWTLNAP